MGSNESFTVGDWLVEPELDRITRDSEITSLRPRVMEFLVYLARQDGSVVSTDDLINDLWAGKFVTDGTVYNCVTELRHALAEGQDGQTFIENIPKKGYRLVAPVAGLDEARNEGLGRRRSSWTISTPAITVITVLLLGMVGIYAWTMLSESNRGLEPIPDHAVRPPANSVTVLPFINNSGSAENEYFSDGLTETLLHALAQLPDLKVTARTSAFYFKGQNLNVREIADKLGVSKVLEGSVQRDGNRVRILVRLIEAETGFQLWSDTYDRELSDIFEVQENIANSVALAMRANLSGVSIETASTDSVAAYEKYLKGLHQKNINSNTPLLEAEILFKEALALDPGYYAARLELAHTYRDQQIIGEITTVEAIEHLGPLTARLLEERPIDGLALSLAGYLQFYESITQSDVSFDVEKQLAALTAAVERTPNEPELYRSIYRILSNFSDRREEAIEWLERGIAIDPLNSGLNASLGAILLRAGHIDGADASIARAIELNPDNPSNYSYAATISWERKQYAKSFALRRKSMELGTLDYEFPTILALNLYLCGLMDEGDQYLQRAIAIAPDKAFPRQAKLHRLLLLDDHARARQMSESMLRDDIDNRNEAYREAVMVFMSTMSELDKTDEALAFLEELRPGVTSPDFDARTTKEHVLQYHAILALAQSQSKDDSLNMLDGVVPRWDEFVPSWRSVPGAEGPIAMARGQTELAAELTIKALENAWHKFLFYRHIDYYKELALLPSVAERLVDLEVESKKAGEDIWAYIVEHQLQL